MLDTFPVLNTDRLILRKVTVDDVDALVKYANNRKISEAVLNIPHPYQEPDAVFRIAYVYQGFKSGRRYVFAIIDRSTEELIGEIGLHVESKTANVAQLGYWIGEPFWNKGFATEAAQSVLTFGFEKLQLKHIYAECSHDHIASKRVMSKLNMQLSGTNGLIERYEIIKG